MKRGDTLLSWSGTPGTSFGCFRWDGPEGWLNQHIFNVRLDSEVLPAFFIHQVNSKLNELIGKAHGGVGLQHITRGALSSVVVAVPPLAEQMRIVQLLDEAGKLRSLRTQADRRTADLIPAISHEMFGDSAANSKKWPVELLPDVAFFQEGPGVRNWQFRSTGIKLINVGNIVGGKLDLSNTDRHLSHEEVAKTYSHFLLSAGDLVMATSGATWGKVAFVEPHHLPLCMNTSVVRFRPLTTESCTPSFLRAFFESKNFRRQIEQLITGSAQPNFGPSHLKRIRIRVPPLPIQMEFAGRVTEIRSLERKQAASQERLDALFHSMLHRAFNGEL